MCITPATALKVFLVEDSPLILERLQAMLASISGATTVGHAARADDAVRGILETKPHAVVLDITLAQGSGLDVLRAVNDLAPGTEIYMLTNSAGPAYRRIAAQLGARGFFDKSTEFALVRDVLAARAAGQAH
jgi:DNA-binding NarL/FixJ family response regulator